MREKIRDGVVTTLGSLRLSSGMLPPPPASPTLSTAGGLVQNSPAPLPIKELSGFPIDQPLDISVRCWSPLHSATHVASCSSRSPRALSVLCRSHMPHSPGLWWPWVKRRPPSGDDSALDSQHLALCSHHVGIGLPTTRLGLRLGRVPLFLADRCVSHPPG